MSARIAGQSGRFGRRWGGAAWKAWRPDRQNRGVRFVRDRRLTLRSLAYRLGCRNREGLHNRSEPDERQVVGTRPCAIRLLLAGAPDGHSLPPISWCPAAAHSFGRDRSLASINHVHRVIEPSGDRAVEKALHRFAVA
jgi:hypothetical protein